LNYFESIIQLNSYKKLFSDAFLKDKN